MMIDKRIQRDKITMPYHLTIKTQCMAHGGGKGSYIKKYKHTDFNKNMNAQKQTFVAPEPRNASQKKYVEYLRGENPYIVLGTGAAGTGKTFWATMIGLEKLESKEVSRVILTRPAIGIDNEQHGFLPGTIDSKMKPWVLPIYDSLYRKMEPSRIEQLIESKQLEIAPLAYMRGRTFEDAYIILDEAQNCSPNQIKAVLTRIGKGSKLVLTGDPTQYDKETLGGESGLIDLLRRIIICGGDENDIAIVNFTDKDVERHPVIPYIIGLYNTEL